MDHDVTETSELPTVDKFNFRAFASDVISQFNSNTEVIIRTDSFEKVTEKPRKSMPIRNERTIETHEIGKLSERERT